MIEGNEEVARFLVTKHSLWKGKYKRILSIGSLAICTLSPQTLETTNAWPYNEITNVLPSPKANNEFVLHLRKGKKSDKMNFSCDHRAELLTQAFKYSSLFAAEVRKNHSSSKYEAFKYHWSETKIRCYLTVRSYGVMQLDYATEKCTATYDFKDIECLALVEDSSKGCIIQAGGFGRKHLFFLDQCEDFLGTISDKCTYFLGFDLKPKKEKLKIANFSEVRLGSCSCDDAVTSIAEFVVLKHHSRHHEPVKRLLCISEQCLVERDPATYAIPTLRTLNDIFALIRYTDDPQLFTVEYCRGVVRRYSSTERDSLLSTLLDSVRAAGNKDVCVKMGRTKRGLRLGPLLVPIDEEGESLCLKMLSNPAPGMTFQDALQLFNANISYSGVIHAVTQEGFFTENKERLIFGALQSIVNRRGDEQQANNEELEGQFHALRRLVASRAGYAGFLSVFNLRVVIGEKVIEALKRKDEGITHAAMDLLCTLMQPMHDNYDLGQEQLNKKSLLSSKPFVQKLLDEFQHHVNLGTGALAVSSILDFLTFAMCPPYSETTESEQFDLVLELVAGLGRTVFKLFLHSSMAIVKGAGLLMKAIIEEADEEVSKRMQLLALAEGALCKHLHTSLFTYSADNRMLTHRQLSRHLVALWVQNNEVAMELLRNIMPVGMLDFLESEEKVPAREEDRMHIRDNVHAIQTLSKRRLNSIEGTLLHWRNKLKSKPGDSNRPVTLRRRRQILKSELNWDYFYYQFMEDHAKASLIWNHKTREELKDSLENELRAFTIDKDLVAGNEVTSWNFIEFEVRYECLSDEIKIGDYYLRLLLDEGTTTAKIHNPLQFFNDIYHRFLLTQKPTMRGMCLQAMSIVYDKYYEEVGTFNDVKFLVRILEHTKDKLERDRLLFFFNRLFLVKRNVKEFVDGGGMKVLLDLVTLAHLHTSRAQTPMQSNLLEAPAGLEYDIEKEWYYGNKDKERFGPFSFKEMKEFWKEQDINETTRCWAQGLDGWKPLRDIAQLKWCLLATGNALMNETDLADLILNLFIRIVEYYPSRDVDNAIIRPLPKCKRVLSDPNVLPHIVQLLVTFDPGLVDKTVRLLNMVMEDNPQLPRVFMTGAFFFIMMYTGSNILPIGRFLKYTHMRQSFRPEEITQTSSDIMLQSVLGQLLPEAMVCYLENHGPEKFAETFLGDFDTPEAIWSHEMRRLLIERIAAHIGDFTPRLQSNTRSLYQYCSIPIIQYPQLENELFCNIYYLRHLCNTTKFPDWPIKEPIKLLKNVLEEWKREVDKKPPSITWEEAYKILNLPIDRGQQEQAVIRKAYFKMAQKYHPDKNPNGRQVFDQVNKSYEFLCSVHVNSTIGPDPVRVVLLLQTQSILFKRYSDVLQPYKYAGYPMLIKTISFENDDSSLFIKSTPLLPAAAELCFHTINTSALNVEELRRENGLEHLQNSFDRCLDIISFATVDTDTPAVILGQVLKCYSVAVCFEGCREKIYEMPGVISGICRTFYYKNTPQMCMVTADCVSAFAQDAQLQTSLLENGVLWHLLLFLFKYDYTLDESGVVAKSETNMQEIHNELARKCIHAVRRLGGRQPVDETAMKTPDNQNVNTCLVGMLTYYLSRQMGKLDIREFLKLFSSNTESPYLIWDNRTRAELNQYLETQQELQVKTSSGEAYLGATFKFCVLTDELVVGNTYVRVYNEQPMFVLEDPSDFAANLIEFLGQQAQYLQSRLVMGEPDLLDGFCDQTRIKHCEMSLQALENVIKNNPGSEIQCIGHFTLLFSLLSIQDTTTLKELSINVILSVTGSKKCVNNIADANTLHFLLMALPSLPNSHCTIIEILMALCSHTAIIKEVIQKGGLIYLLDLFCNANSGEIREATATLFSKMIADKLAGPKVRIIIIKFLPLIFLDAMRDNPEAAVHMFENVHENPELIWNDEARNKVSNTVAEMAVKVNAMQKEDPLSAWRLPEDFTVAYSEIDGEVEVGGVYLRLYINQPSWVLRRPKEFLIAILDRFCLLCDMQSPDGQVLEMVTTALVCFLIHHTALADQIPPLGHIPRIFTLMTPKNASINKSCVDVLLPMADSEVCVRTIAKCKSLDPLITAMKTRNDIILPANEVMSKMLDRNIPELVSQALEVGMVHYLLALLENSLENVDNVSAVKAQIVKVLKAMSQDLSYGARVNEILESSSIWSIYKEQKHDLFLTDTRVSGYLTGPGIAGYLTAPTVNNKTLSSAPPPLVPPDDHDHQD